MTEPQDRDRRPDESPALDEPETGLPGTDSGFANLNWQDIDVQDTDWHSADWEEAHDQEQAHREEARDREEAQDQQEAGTQESAREPEEPAEQEPPRREPVRQEQVAQEAPAKQQPAERATVERADEAGQAPSEQREHPEETESEEARTPHEPLQKRVISQLTGLRGANRPKWTTVGFTIVAAVLVFSLVRALMGSPQPVNNAGAPPPPPPPTVLINGVGVPMGGPVISLDPGLIRQGTKVGVNGSGFDTGAAVDLQFLLPGSKQPLPVGGGTVGPDGTLLSGFMVPPMPGANHAQIIARERNSNKIASADAEVPTAAAGTISMLKPTGRPGDTVTVSGSGFLPGEKVDAYWGGLSGAPTGQVQADQGGGFGQGRVPVGIGPAGMTTLLMVGEQSKTTATLSFYMQGLYPVATVTPYAAKAAQPISVSGSGFAPNERVLLYINRSAGPPVAVLPGSPNGAVSGARFIAPFKLTGSQRLMLVGEQSRATASSGFTVLPYTPTAQPSAYGGMPGTTLSFYVTDFAPNEVVLVYANTGPGKTGDLVSAFRVNGRGGAAAAGSWQIPSNAQGKSGVTLVGRQSGARAVVTVTVTGGGDADVPPPPKYVLPPDLAADPVVPGGPPPPPPAPPAPPGAPAPPPTR